MTSNHWRRPIKAMLDLIPRSALVELEHAIALELHESREAAEEQESELGCLSELVAEAVQAQLAACGDNEQPIVRVAQNLYDERRSPEAPSGAALSRRYGSWMAACRAAVRLGAVQAPIAASKAWPTPTLWRARPADYTRAEVIAAIEAAASALGVPVGELSANRYYRWIAEQRARARRLGLEPPRLPTQRSVDRLFRRFTNARRAADGA